MASRGKQIDFGTDLGLLVRVVATMQRADYRQFDFWSALKHANWQVWEVVAQWIDERESMERLIPNPSYTEHGKRGALNWPVAPEVITLSEIVQNGRACGFGKREWAAIADGTDEMTTDLLDWLTIHPPHFIDVRVDYSVKPRIDPRVVRRWKVKKGRTGIKRMSLYAHPEAGVTSFSDLETELARVGLRFADHYELGAFHEHMWRSVRPWFFIYNPRVFAAKSRRFGVKEGDLWGGVWGAELIPLGHAVDIMEQLIAVRADNQKEPMVIMKYFLVIQD